MNPRPFIAVEWGTASIRARLLKADGRALEQMIEHVNLADLDEAAMTARIEHIRARWQEASETIWLAGMIGSPLGLETVQQLPCPATPVQLAQHARRTVLGGRPAMILPGLSCTSRFGSYDVLRGEEVSAAGLVGPATGNGALLLSVPGMHGKWIELSRSRIERFHTSMTVELHRAIAESSILKPLMAAAPSDNEPFRAGLSVAAAGGSLARLLFSARTKVLAKQLSETDAASYIWGVLVGSDVGENLPAAVGSERRFFVTGADNVALLFHAAITQRGVAAELINNDILSAIGFARIRQSMSQGDGG